MLVNANEIYARLLEMSHGELVALAFDMTVERIAIKRTLKDAIPYIGTEACGLNVGVISDRCKKIVEELK